MEKFLIHFHVNESVLVENILLSLDDEEPRNKKQKILEAIFK